MKTVIMDCVYQFFRGKLLVKALNHTFLTLNPKTYPTTDLANFRPVLCGFDIKLLTKMLAFRMFKVVLELITLH